MSVYYSRYNLNTYYNTPYFQAHLPEEYPLDKVLRKSRAFRRLPPNFQELSRKSKEWAILKLGYPTDTTDYGYDEDGYELDPTTGKRLTDKEIDEQWKGIKEESDFEVEDIPLPAGGFPDPDTWEAPVGEDGDVDEDADTLTEEQILADIKARGREYTARYYGVPKESLVGVKNDKELTQIIVNMRG